MPGAVGVTCCLDMGDGSRPRNVPGVGVLSSMEALAAAVKGSAEPGLDAGVRSWVAPELESEMEESMEEELPWPERMG